VKVILDGDVSELILGIRALEKTRSENPTQPVGRYHSSIISYENGVMFAVWRNKNSFTVKQCAGFKKDK